ncbi:MAG: protein kinase [Myxococcales bacterium]|nr:protein kinase [Myxococcales bacterium]MCB9519301.1 protein kinase [Myxococcales bacterium]MCB9530745.1 protein kinase [Myxococcales bacterium]MCB9533361.1 protein kinase [Myxococcales bacterium]
MQPPERFGPFELLERLAVGGMAVTWLARLHGDPPGRELVVKRILPALAADPELRELFLAEAAVAEHLVHPNVVQTLGHGEIDGELYLAMSYVWGEDLRRLAQAAAKHHVALPIAAVTRVVADAARGLHYAHTARDPVGQQPLGLVHRDVSPPNIMVRFDGGVTVVDFGIAKLGRQFQRARAGQLKGKFAYMSPEQVQGLPVDARSDLFSLGVVLHEFTVGQRLFREDSDIATIAAIASADVPPPSTLVADYPPALEAAVMRALSADPRARHASAGELADDLEGVLASLEGGTTAAVGALASRVFADRIAALDALGVPHGGPETPSSLAPRPPATVSTMTDPNAPGSEPTSAAPPSEASAALKSAAVPSPDDPGASAVVELPDLADGFGATSRGGTARAVLALVAALVVVLGAMAVLRGGAGTPAAPPATVDAPPVPVADTVAPPPPRATPELVATTVTSEPPGAAIAVNGVAARAVTPADVPVPAGGTSVVSLHLEGFRTEYVSANPGEAVAASLQPFSPNVDPASDAPEGTGSASDGSGAATDTGPGPGRGRVEVRVRSAAGDRVAAEVLVNGTAVGTAPLTVDVPALQDQLITARYVGFRDSAAYVRAPLWRGPASSGEVTLELSPDVGAAPSSLLRVTASPVDAGVDVGGESGVGGGLYTARGFGPTLVHVVAPDYVAADRAVDWRLGQLGVNAILVPLTAAPATLTIEVEPADAMVLVERIRHGSPGARQLRTPVVDVPVEAGRWRVAFQYTDEAGRARGRFEVELAPGPNTLRYRREGETFVAVE